MLELAIADNEHFAVSRFEIERAETSYTVDTLRHFHRQEPNAELFLLVGADMLCDLPNWREAAEVCRLATPVGVQRPGSPALDYGCLSPIASPEQIERFQKHRVEMPQIAISSTEIRRRLAAGQSIRYQTPRPVDEYLTIHWPLTTGH